jgi:hypothetical protein
VLQAEMLDWSAGRQSGYRPFDGSVRSLVYCYESDPDSPYYDLRPTTQKTYSSICGFVTRVGDRQIAFLTGDDVKRWYKIAAPKKAAGRNTYPYHDQDLQGGVSWGASRGRNLIHPNPCGPLREQLAAVRFRQPPARKTRLTYRQLIAFCDRAARPIVATGFL